MSAMSVKVFQIGFNKCGTRTLFHYFRTHGFRAVHWHKGKLARTIFDNMSNGRDLLRGYEDFDIFTDMEWITKSFALEGYKLFPFFADAYPDAVFILNTRDREDWIKSRFNHQNGTYVKKWKGALNISDDAALADFWRADWDNHHSRVEQYFADKPARFVKFDIAKDSPEVFSRLFPGHELDASAYSQKGKTKSAARQA
jgi:hypothetical protein